LAPTAQDFEVLLSYAWPGNVRELSAVMERAAILGEGKTLEVARALGVAYPRAESRPSAGTTLPSPSAGFGAGPVPEDARGIVSLDDAMARHIERVLLQAHGRIEGPHGAARSLGINPHTLRARMRKLGINWRRFRPTQSQ
jgi:transcriptional regulator with GAF, ATPase, and Fis domain